jgi:hypothetical protein
VSIYELDISWATTANERRYLRWELLVSDEVCGVFRTLREDVLAVLFDGDRRGFEAWARTLGPDEECTKSRTHDSHPAAATTNRGAL